MDRWMDGWWVDRKHFFIGFHFHMVSRVLLLLLTKQLTSLNLGINHLNGVRLSTQTSDFREFLDRNSHISSIGSKNKNKGKNTWIVIMNQPKKKKNLHLVVDDSPFLAPSCYGWSTLNTISQNPNKMFVGRVMSLGRSSKVLKEHLYHIGTFIFIFNLSGNVI